MQDTPLPDTDIVYQGLTRPPTIAGVPMVYMGGMFIFGSIGLIAFLSLTAKFIWVISTVTPLYVYGYLLTEKDPFWMHILMVKCTQKIVPVRNYRHWGCNSYTP